MGKPPLATSLAACRNNPNTFVRAVLGLQQGEVHKEFQFHLSSHDSCHTELHRGCGKTTQVAARCAYEIGHDQNIRIKYVQQSDVEAEKTTELIKHIVDSPTYRMIFPDVRPDLSLWGKTAFRVRRSKLSRDATVQASGIFGRSGGRWDLLVGDDICDLRNAVQQPALREQVREAWANTWGPMADETADRCPRCWTVGTPWHKADITSDWREYHGERGSLLRRPVVGFRSPWHEAWSADRLREWREKHGELAYARAYLLEPMSADQLIFPAEWLDRSMYVGEIPRWEKANGRPVATFDFAFSEKKLKDDPDWSVCLIGHMARNGHLYLLDVVRIQATFPDFARAAIERCNLYGVQAARAEANGPQRGLVQQLNTMTPFPVSPVERTTDKVTRAAERQSFVETGRFHLPADPGREGRVSKRLAIVYKEMTEFPASGHDDTVDTCVDMMGMATAVHARPGVVGGRMQETIYG